VLQVDAAVDESVGVQAVGEVEVLEHVDAGLLEHPGADAAEHVLAGPVLDDDERDTTGGEDVTEQETGGAGPDDRHTGALLLHGAVPLVDVQVPGACSPDPIRGCVFPLNGKIARLRCPRGNERSTEPVGTIRTSTVPPPSWCAAAIRCSRRIRGTVGPLGSRGAVAVRERRPRSGAPQDQV
jgi:hypothetical protein